MNEADTCRTYVVPALQAAGWDTHPCAINEQVNITAGRIHTTPTGPLRGMPLRADYIIRYTRDIPLAVVEAKADEHPAAAGLQQAMRYAELLGLKFAYATNGLGIIEHDYLTGQERELAAYPTPAEMWARLQAAAGLSPSAEKILTTPRNHQTGKPLRYYQERAVSAILDTIVAGRDRILVTMATGTGKTMVAFQVCWQLWSARWNRSGTPHRPRMLYLTDRNILVDDPKDKMFAPFGEARFKIENGQASTSREMYFAIYQALTGGEAAAPLYRQYPQDFFDLIIVDECHRGSASEDSEWRDILSYFAPAVQLGMTATPLRDESRDTYAYFGNPVYTYSLRQGIEDGFLAPYRVHRVVTDVDATGWRPTAGQLDRLRREIPDELFGTPDFERILVLRARTDAIARHISDYLRRTGGMDKTIVFCVDQEHALDMRRALAECNADLVQQFPNYVCRVTADEGEIGRAFLSRFQEVDGQTPVILTTSQLLTTGVDAPTIRNIVIARVVGSMAEFKQIIGRGTRVREDYGKLFFSILDYTGSATARFADPDFDGEPEVITTTVIDANGQPIEPAQPLHPLHDPWADIPYATNGKEEGSEGNSPTAGPGFVVLPPSPLPAQPRKYYVDDTPVEIVAEIVYDLDAAGNRLRSRSYTDYTGDTVRTLFPSVALLRNYWANPDARGSIVAQLKERGIDPDAVTAALGQPDADPFDLLCSLAYNAPIHTRRERADRLRREQAAFFDRYGDPARGILAGLLDKYADYGVAQFNLPDALKLPPIADYGNVTEIAQLFGGPTQLRSAVADLQKLLYAA